MTLATFGTHGYELDDAQQRARESPDFEVPSAAEIRRLLFRGNLVKLIFLFPPKEAEIPLVSSLHGTIRHPSGERMWVLIDRVEGDLVYGTLNNEPAFFDSRVLTSDAPVTFELRHIADIVRGPA